MDDDWHGFEWINADDADRSIFSFVRKAPAVEALPAQTGAKGKTDKTGIKAAAEKIAAKTAEKAGPGKKSR